jgi:hypothetical protein
MSCSSRRSTVAQSARCGNAEKEKLISLISHPAIKNNYDDSTVAVYLRLEFVAPSRVELARISRAPKINIPLERWNTDAGSSVLARP